jgi:hypothetical protein
MGGLRVVPDIPLAEFEPDTAAILILPGGDSWMAVQHAEITSAVRAMESDRRLSAGLDGSRHEYKSRLKGGCSQDWLPHD